MSNHHHHSSVHHHGEHDHSHVHSVTENLKVAFALNATFTIIEVIGGLLTNSIAVLSDAIHDLGDTIAIGSALFLEKKSEQKRDANFSYGYRRWSTLSALINVVILTTGSVFIIVETIPRLLSPQEVHSSGMIGLAILGVLMNGAAVFRLKGNKHSINNRTVLLHLLEDTLGWAAILIGAIIIHFTGWIIIDPVLSLLIAGIILRNAVKNLRSILNIFLQAVPKQLDMQAMEDEIQRIEHVEDVHDIHVWSLDGEFHVGSLHLVLKEKERLQSSEDIKSQVREVFKNNGIPHVTIELEHTEEDCGSEDFLN